MTNPTETKEIPKVDARHLSAAKQKDLRARGMKMLKAGIPHRKIVKSLGICRSTVFKWSKALRQKSIDVASEGEKRGPKESTNERRSTLTYAQQAVIRREINEKTPLELSLDSALWTVSAIQELIVRTYKVNFSRTTLFKYLRRWGFTAQKPFQRALGEREKISPWLKQTYPSIVTKAKKEESDIFWADETQVQPDSNWTRLLSLAGQTPTIQSHDDQSQNSTVMITAIQNKGRIHFKVQKKAVNAHEYLGFLKGLVQNNIGKKVFVIVDNTQIHHDPLVRKWVEQNTELIELFFLGDQSS